MNVRIEEWSVENPQLIEGLCLHPSDPRKMLEVMAPHMEARKRWLQGMAGKGLRVAVATGADGEKQGLVEYVPIEWAAEPVAGSGSLFINCLWVLPRYWGTGVGRALLEYAVAQASTNGIAVLGYERDRWFGYFRYMPVEFFRRFGFTEVDRDGSRVLLYLEPAAERRRSPLPSLMCPGAREGVKGEGGRHVVEILYSSQCPWSGWMIDGAMRGLRRLGVEVCLVNTDERTTAAAYGLTRGVCVDGRPLVHRLASGREVVRAVQGYLQGAHPRFVPDHRGRGPT
ncbi:MAG: GNAT family N-acetyltransferase [Bacillota bacterium]|nr:GNAT family N-acetyltransferase [Bacillota bacterium]